MWMACFIYFVCNSFQKAWRFSFSFAGKLSCILFSLIRIKHTKLRAIFCFLNNFDCWLAIYYENVCVENLDGCCGSTILAHSLWKCVCWKLGWLLGSTILAHLIEEILWQGWNINFNFQAVWGVYIFCCCS